MMRTEEAVSVDQTLYVHLLGGFSLYYGDNPVSFKRGVTTKSMQLLQILLHSGEKGRVDPQSGVPEGMSL